ncbi:hypothetical protein QC764_0092250 [Podospora pseudoanserina]|uniref:Uncharacterized protein n=1 Tax=Podospora pseudoanserina TaxID=2609844 RepID=A0ABR0HT52_9PEZI|nr:hypothetical protein QC764_0092250 [Podospora pseudoanserina]
MGMGFVDEESQLLRSGLVADVSLKTKPINASTSSTRSVGDPGFETTTRRDMKAGGGWEVQQRP